MSGIKVYSVSIISLKNIVIYYENNEQQHTILIY